MSSKSVQDIYSESEEPNYIPKRSAIYKMISNPSMISGVGAVAVAESGSKRKAGECQSVSGPANLWT